MERALAWSLLAETHGAKGAKATIGQHRPAVLQQRRTTNLAFATRHPFDAIKVGSSWYKLYKSPVNWKMAAQMCEEAGGSLPIIDSQVKNQAIAQLLTTVLADDARGQCWLGLTDEVKEGDWRWTNGVPLAATGFTSWMAKNPDNNAGAEHYASLEAAVNNGQLDIQWNDQTEGKGYPVLCEWQQ